jgi:basic amino acid/polyamine antiporter, APA family
VSIATGSGGLQLARRLGVFDATMIVMGGVVGSGIFINPYVVAGLVRDPAQILGAWIFGGLIALAGGFLYAELAARRPLLNGQYAYLREAFHPAVAFLYGWVLLLVIQTGGMAAVAITFARYFLNITSLDWKDSLVAAMVLMLLTLVNCLGVKAGATVQSALMVLKIVAIAVLVICGFALGSSNQAVAAQESASFELTRFGAAMTPVLFAYGGWQTASFVAAEMRDPSRDLRRAMILGVIGVVVLYVSINVVYLWILGAQGLADSKTPASTVMERVMGINGARFTALAITVSTLGFLSQGMLTAPRVYFSMAADGLFFRQIAQVSAKSQAPVAAILLQGFFAAVIATVGGYEKILSYVVSVDFFFIGLTAASLIVFRRRDDSASLAQAALLLFFVTASWWVVASTVLHDPVSSGMGILILAAGLPAYWFWSSRTPRIEGN